MNNKFDEHYLSIEQHKSCFEGIPRVLVCEGKRPRTKKNIVTNTWGYSSRNFLYNNYKAVVNKNNESILGFAFVTGIQPYTTKKLVVVDVDITDYEQKNKLINCLPSTFTVESASGGLHFYYYTTEPLTKTVIRYKGFPVDVLNNASIVVFPNAINGYTVSNNVKVHTVANTIESDILSLLSGILIATEKTNLTQRILVVDSSKPKKPTDSNNQINNGLIPVGTRNMALVQYAGKINKYCLSRGHLTMSLKLFRDTCCEESGTVSNEEIKSIVGWISKKDANSFTMFNKPNVLTHSTTIDFRTFDKKFVKSLIKATEQEKYSSFEELKIKHKDFVEQELGIELKTQPPNHVLADLLKEHGFVQHRVGKQRLRKWNAYA